MKRSPMKRHRAKPRPAHETALLEWFRGQRCEWCGKPPRSQACHIITKGMGGAHEINDRLNLVALCHHCHIDEHHHGRRPTVADLKAVVQRRERIKELEHESRLLSLRKAIPKDAWMKEKQT